VWLLSAAHRNTSEGRGGLKTKLIIQREAESKNFEKLQPSMERMKRRVGKRGLRVPPSDCWVQRPLWTEGGQGPSMETMGG
jgi:hypothetical protein